MAGQVWSVEIIEEFAQAESRLRHRLSQYRHPRRRRLSGWAEHAPFDKISWPRRSSSFPGPLEQLFRGPPVPPMGSAEAQARTIIDKDAAGAITVRELIPVQFSQLETVM